MRNVTILSLLLFGLTIVACCDQDTLADNPCQNITLIGDLNHDCKVDFEDFARMAANWLMDCIQDPANGACLQGNISAYAVTGAGGANGSISPSGDTIKYYGENLTLTANPASGYTISKWTLDGNESQTGGDTFTLTNIGAGHTVVVSFKPLIPTYTITAIAGANGSVDPNGTTIKNQGENITLTAIPDFDYTIDKWMLDGNDVQIGGTTFTLLNITAGHTVSVSFTNVLTYAVTATADANGSVDPNGTTIKNKGENLTLTATPGPGYTVDKWTQDDSQIRTGGTSFTLLNITADHFIRVSFKPLPTTIIAAADSNESEKAIANLICTGIKDDAVINNAIVSRNAAGGGTVFLLPGTYKIRSRVLFRDNTANIVFRGSGRSTILEKDPIPGTMSGSPVAATGYSVVIAATEIFTPDMVGQVIQFDTSNTTYQIKQCVSSTEIQIGDWVYQGVKYVDGTNDASSETAGDTFRIADTYSTVYQQYRGHHLRFQDFAIDTKNVGYNHYAGNKGLFINGNSDDYSLCHHIYIERVFSKNPTAEAICIDYAQYAYITDCNTENSAWAGATLAQVKYGAIRGCHIYRSGTANHTISLGAGINCQNVEQGLIADNYIDTPRDVGLAIATQELMSGRYPSAHVTVRNNTIINANNISATSVILLYRTQGGTSSVRNDYIDVIGNSISGDVGAYHGILVNNSNHVNVLNNAVLGGGASKYGIYFGNQVDTGYYDGNSESSRYTKGVLVDLATINITVGTNTIVP